MQDVLNRVLLSTVTALEVGRENCVMSSKYHVKLPHKTEVYLGLSFVKTEDIARMLMMEQIATNVSAGLDLKEVIVKRT